MNTVTELRHYTRRGISGVAKQQQFSQNALCSTELIFSYHRHLVYKLIPNLNKNGKVVTGLFVDGRTSQGISVPVFDTSVETKFYVL